MVLLIETRYHPLIDCDTDGVEKAPMFQSWDGKVVADTHKMYLSEMIPNYFRLHSKKSMSQRATDKLTIHCPLCGSSLRRIANNCNNHRLGLYTCDKCKRD